MKLSEFLVLIGLTKSKSESKRYIKQGSVKMIQDGITYILKSDCIIKI